ncbi:DUF4479 and tRNA-binding domain-containing protein [Sporolactobacillus shoreicorticis]|uniref:YtpR family tRNA-binding protein n=1 Tax=Sporolactobacillus shoreicorticis TaxID=1923877 RepID=A0ABW5RZC6_9BACL|nr:DUF4479 domain-containing protein [Sporolactobacillus shoreicorticis]MCO7124884.1 DUF4479 and tRNA-binding domain-containing protein [Sporolactobacillus shoreicorticis]
MILYYNRQGIGDILIIYLKDGEKEKSETKGKVTRIFDGTTNETLGFNISHASQFLKNQQTGLLNADTELIELLNQKLADEKIDFSLPKAAKPLIVTGYVRHLKEHPNSDHMHVCQVECGDEILQIVCGAPNINQGQKVVVARLGALMPNGTIIRPTVLRGVVSDGMICSARELALPNAPQKRGILVLDSSIQIGQDFYAFVAKNMRV